MDEKTDDNHSLKFENNPNFCNDDELDTERRRNKNEDRDSESQIQERDRSVEWITQQNPSFFQQISKLKGQRSASNGSFDSGNRRNDQIEINKS